MGIINPDDTSRPFVARWNALVSALLVESSIKLIARTACDYGIMDGEDVYPGNERLARQTGYDERTVREAWHFLRACSLAERVELGAWSGSRRNADRYALVIPDEWRRWPMLGPHAGKFTCQDCGKRFSPPPCNTYQMRQTAGGEVPLSGKDGTRQVAWYLWRAAFCPTPKRGPDRGDGCFESYKRNHKWGGEGAWRTYLAARNDDWPPLANLAAA